MAKFKRRRIPRYTTIDTGIPPLESSSKSNYPSFSPEIGSFNKDKFHRSANTFSDKNFQLFTKFTESDSYNAEAYKKAIMSGVDLFKKNTYDVSKWVETKSIENGPYTTHIKNSMREPKDHFSVRKIPPQDWDQFLHIYGPTKFFNLITQLFEYVYTALTREQVHSFIFTYYFFYFYFYFTEYILENVCLYFPIVRIFFSNQIFSTFEGVYFSFFQIILGFFIPVFLIFIFSQFSLMRSFFTHGAYFVGGSTIFFYTFTLPFIYYFTGFSDFFLFFSFFIFFSFLFVFYIFEYKPGVYFDQTSPSSYTTYFLPIVEDKKVLYLPKYFYKFRKWPVSTSNYSKSVFTRFPFTQNVNSIFIHYKRISRVTSLEYSLSPAKLSSIAPVMSITGLIFPKLPNSYAYDIQSYRKSISFYPQKRFSPFAETSDHDYYDNFERDQFPIFVRDYINNSDGYSQISFIEFVSKNTSFRTFDNQFKLINDEENDFYNSVPSKKAFQYLYPFFYLKMWLNSINPSNFRDDEFTFQNIGFSNKNLRKDQIVPVFIPKFLVSFINTFFNTFRFWLDKFTFYAYKKFSTPDNTSELLSNLKSANKILIDAKRLSPLYYKNLFIFIVRSVRCLNKTFIEFENLSIRQIFTYTLILIQIEEIYFNINQRMQYLDRFSLDYRVGNFFLTKFKPKLDGFSQINLFRK